MAAKTFDEIYWNGEGTEFIGIVDSATASDTVDVSSYLNGKTIISVTGTNISDTTLLTYTYNSSNVITVPSGPSTDKIAIIVKVLNC